MPIFEGISHSVYADFCARLCGNCVLVGDSEAADFAGLVEVCESQEGSFLFVFLDALVADEGISASAVGAEVVGGI